MLCLNFSAIVDSAVTCFISRDGEKSRKQGLVQVTCVSATSGPFGLPLLEPLLACLNATNATVLQNHLIASRCLPERHAPPGWCQVHFSHLMRPYEVDYVIRAVAEVGAHAWKLLPLYKLDPCTGAVPPTVFSLLTACEQNYM